MKTRLKMMNKGIRIENMALILSNLLADEMSLYFKTKKFLWHVCGISYLELHQFQRDDSNFSGDYIYKESEKIHHPVLESSNLYEYVSSGSSIDENATVPAIKETLQLLIDDHAAIICGLRFQIEKKSERFNHDVSADFLNSLLTENEISEKVLRRVLI